MIGAGIIAVVNNLLNPKGALFYLGVFSQVIRPDTPGLHALTLVSAMVSTSALFWLAFVASLHLAPVRRWVARSRRAVTRSSAASSPRIPTRTSCRRLARSSA